MKVSSVVIQILLLAFSSYHVMSKEVVRKRDLFSSKIGDKESSSHRKVSETTRHGETCPFMADCEGRTYIRWYNFTEYYGMLDLDFDEAIANIGYGPRCIMAPPGEVQEQFGYQEAMFGPSLAAGPAWVGAYKDPVLLYSGLTPAGAGEGIIGWTNLDGSKWHVNSTTQANSVWAASEPAAGNGVVAINGNGKLVALKANDRLEGGFYKCCQDQCASPIV